MAHYWIHAAWELGEGCYKLIAILDEEALLATCVYIDLNPLAAVIAATPETSRHTSVRQRLRHARQRGQLESLKAAARSSMSGSQAAKKLEESHWRCPVEDRRGKDWNREGKLANFSLGSYLLLVDYTSRLFRVGKASVSREVAGIFERLGTSGEFWGDRLRRLLARPRQMGSYVTTRSSRLKETAAHRGVHHIDNALGSLRVAG